MSTEALLGTGRRKTSTARVRLFPSGNGEVEINGKNLETYFPIDRLRTTALKPLFVVNRLKTVSVSCQVEGGGVHSQAGAVSHAITRALLKLDSNFRKALKIEGLITRDPRMKERKKYGQKGARKRFQFSKR